MVNIMPHVSMLMLAISSKHHCAWLVSLCTPSPPLLALATTILREDKQTHTVLTSSFQAIFVSENKAVCVCGLKVFPKLAAMLNIHHHTLRSSRETRARRSKDMGINKQSKKTEGAGEQKMRGHSARVCPKGILNFHSLSQHTNTHIHKERERERENEREKMIHSRCQMCMMPKW